MQLWATMSPISFYRHRILSRHHCRNYKVVGSRHRLSRVEVKYELGHSDWLDDLEDGWSAHHKNEESQQPWTDWVLFLLFFGRLWYVSTLCNRLGGLLVLDADSLLQAHFCDLFCVTEMYKTLLIVTLLNFLIRQQVPQNGARDWHVRLLAT